MEALIKKRLEMKGLQEQAVKLYDGIGAGNTPTAEQMSQASDINKKLADLSAEIKNLEEIEGMHKTAKDFLKDWSTPANQLPQDAKGIEAEVKEIAGRVSIFKAVAEDAAFKQWLKNGAVGNSPSVSVPAYKTLITGASDTSAGALVVNDRTGIFDTGTIIKQLGVLDLIQVVPTNSDTVEWVKVTSYTNNAAETAEAEADGNPTGAKPESAMAMAVAQAAVQNIAHWIPATRRALADAGQLQSLIGDLLGYGLRERLSDQVISGDGIAPNLAGITSLSPTAQTYSASIVETLLKARTKVRTTGKGMPTAYALNPADNETLLLAQDAEDRYYFGGPNAYGVRTCWGLPVIEDETITAGTGYCADWTLAKLFVRENIVLRVAEQHSDYFTKNIVTFLAEMRCALGVIRPAAFVEIDLTP